MINIFTTIIAACLLSTSNLQANYEEIENQQNNNILIIDESEDTSNMISETDQTDIYTSSTYSFDDDYEDNETVDTAYSLNVNNFYCLESYTNSINGNLNNYFSVDYDWFYFVLLTDCNVSISFSTSSSISNDFVIFNYLYDVENSQANRDLNEIISYYDTPGSKSFTDTLSAGTYFICLKGRQEYGSSVSLDYSLSLSVELTESAPNISVDDVLETDYQAVLWMSDLVPANVIPFLNLQDEIVYYQYNENGILTPEYSLNTLKDISGGNPIHVATYYIWDPIIKHIMFQIMCEMITLYNSQIEGIENQIEKYELVHDAAENTIKIICTIAGRVIISNAIKLGIKATQFVSLTTLNFIFNAITPRIGYLDVTMGEFLALYKGYFDLGVEEDKFEDYDYIKNIKDNGEIIAIPIYYSFHETGNPIPRYNKHYISYKETSAMVMNQDIYQSLIYTSGETISSYQELNYYCRGKIYGLNSFDELNNLNQLQEFEKMHNHEYTNYQSVNSSQHKVSCSCGESSVYEEHNYVSASGGQKCIDCGYFKSNHNHSYTYVSCGDGSHHFKQCSCGYSIRESCIGLSNGFVFVCGKCRQEINGDDGPILMGFDNSNEAYIDNEIELTFIKKENEIE